MGAHIVAQRLTHGLAATTQPEAAGMQFNLQAGDIGRGFQQRGGAIAPATEGVIDIMEGCLHFVHHHSRFNSG